MPRTSQGFLQRLCFLLVVAPAGMLARGDQLANGQHETAECSKPDMSLRDLLCARSDTTITCRWLDDDDAENGSGNSSSSSFWSLAAGLTFFVVADAALLGTQGLPSGVVKQVMHVLAGHRPLPSSLSGHSLLWRIARPLPISRLLAISMLPAQLVDSFGGSREHLLGFERSLAGLGANVSVAASSFPSLGLVQSIQVCRSWIHFTDGLLLPPANRGSSRWDNMWPKPLPWSSLGPSLELRCLMTLLVGAAGLLLYTAWARAWLQQLWLYPWHVVARKQPRVPVEEGGAGVQPGTPVPGDNPWKDSLGLEDLAPLVTQRSVEHEQVGMALERLLGSLTQEGGQAIRIQRDGSRGLMLVTEPSRPVGNGEAGIGTVHVSSASTPNLLQLLQPQGEGSETGTPSSPTSSLPLRRVSAEAHSTSSSLQMGRLSKDSDQVGSLSGLPEMEDAAPGRKSLSTRPVGLRPSICGPRSAFFSPAASSAADDPASLAAPVMEETQTEAVMAEAEAEAEAAPPSERENTTMELVSGQLQQADSRFWELEENDLSVCLRPDGTDWQLGSGAFGTVYRGLLQGSTPVAIKFISNQTLKEKLRFIQEIALLRNLRHTNIVQFIGAHIDVEQIVLVTEFMPRGDLWHALSSDHERNFCWAKRGRQVALDVVRGLMYFHSKQCVHLDLKSANVLLSRDGVAKIGDVGLARVLTREGARVSQEGTFEWAAPEVLMGDPCTEKADIYSLGVLLWEIITGEQPRLRSLRPFQPEEAPAPICDIALSCRQNDPVDRPTAADVFAVLSVDRPRPASRALSASSRQSGGGSAVSLNSDNNEPLQLARGGKAHSWDATATRVAGRRPSASRSMDVRASIEPQVSSILELEPPRLGTDQRSDSEGSLKAPPSVREAAASLSAPSSRNEDKGSPKRTAAALSKDASPSREPSRRVSSPARGPSLLGQGIRGSAGLAARSALYTPAKLKDDQKRQQ